MKYFLPLALVFILTGCGSSDEENVTTTIEMEPNKGYEVSKGDKLIKTSSNAQVSIEKSIAGDTTTVTLIEGTATITRSN